MTRAEHLSWCKDRALKYVEIGDLQQALASMMSDLRKHKDTQGHSGIELTILLMMSGDLKTAESVRRHIVGFN